MLGGCWREKPNPNNSKHVEYEKNLGEKFSLWEISQMWNEKWKI